MIHLLEPPILCNQRYTIGAKRAPNEFAARASQSDIDKLKSAPGIDSNLLLIEVSFSFSLPHLFRS